MSKQKTYANWQCREAVEQLHHLYHNDTLFREWFNSVLAVEPCASFISPGDAERMGQIMLESVVQFDPEKSTQEAIADAYEGGKKEGRRLSYIDAYNDAEEQYIKKIDSLKQRIKELEK